jgi:uncharacterized repeat protein (TIGR02543 family)
MNTKRTILFFVCAIFAALFCASCFSSWDGDGLAEVRIGPAGGNARTVRPGESELAGMLVKVTFSGHGKAIEKTFGSEGGKVRLTAGTWQLLSKAYIGGRLRGIADETVSLKPGSSHTIVLDTCIGIKNHDDFYVALGNGINGIGHDDKTKGDLLVLEADVELYNGINVDCDVPFTIIAEPGTTRTIKRANAAACINVTGTDASITLGREKNSGLLIIDGNNINGELFKNTGGALNYAQKNISFVGMGRPEFNIIFDADFDSRTYTHTVYYGDSLPAAFTGTAAPVSQRDGHDFGGYYTEKNGAGSRLYDENLQPVDSSFTVAGNITLYAKWTIKTYTVAFVANGGTETQPKTVNHGGTVQQPTVTKDGCTLEGWYTEPEFNTKWDFTSNAVTGNITLYAKWDENPPDTFTVTFEANGGSPVPEPKPVGNGGKVEQPSDQISKTGHTLDGWYKETTFNNKWNFGSDTVTANITLYAKWVANTYTINFYSNGGTGGTSSAQVIYGAALPNATAPTRSGYTFGGYYTASDGGGTQYYDAQMNPVVTQYTYAGTINLYAKWTANTITITFNPNGGNWSGITGSVTRNTTFGQPVTDPPLPPVRTGFTFAGWFTQASGGEQVNPESCPFSTAQTLYAHWTETGEAWLVELAESLQTLPDNDAQNPHTVALASSVIINTLDPSPNGVWASINNTVQQKQKYVVLDLSACSAVNDCIGLDLSDDLSTLLPNSMNIIKDNQYIKGLILPNTLREIDQSTFSNCIHLVSVTIPASVTKIWNDVFLRDKSLVTIIVDEGNANYSSVDGVFFNKDKTTLFCYPAGKSGQTYTVPNSVTIIDRYAFSDSNITGITIPTSVTAIGQCVFQYCNGLTNVHIPSSVINMGDFVFSTCSNLSSITVDEGNPVFSAVDGVLFMEKDSKKTLVYRLSTREEDSYSIPSGVTNIYNSAFYNNKLASVTIPSSVTTIENFAFQYCKSLTSVTFASGSNIAAGSFKNKVFPEGSDGLGGETLRTAYLSKGAGKYTRSQNGSDWALASGFVTFNTNGALSQTPAMQTVAVGGKASSPAPIIKIGYVFDGWYAASDLSGSRWNFDTNTVNSSITLHAKWVKVAQGDLQAHLETLPPSTPEAPHTIRMASSVIINSYDISATSVWVSVNNAVQAAEKYVVLDLSECSATNNIIAGWYLDPFTGSRNMNIIKDNQYIKGLILPNTLVEIQNSAFYQCKYLTSVIVPSGLAKIGWNAFEACSGLTGISLPANMSDIAGNPFADCSQLTNITVAPGGNYRYSVSNDVLFNIHEAALVCYPAGIAPRAYTIPDMIFNILDGAFSGSKITSVDICADVADIVTDAFTGCSQLASINVDPQNVNYSSEDGVLFDKEKTSLIRYPPNRSGDSYTIPNTVTSLGYRSFVKCSNLTSVSIPSGVTERWMFAFESCSGLASMVIGSGVTVIGKAAFVNCSNLNTVIFETDSIIQDNFGDNAFPAGPDGAASNDLKNAYLAGGAGTYTRSQGGTDWVKQP